MPERGFDTGFWTDDFVMELPYPAKHLLHYLGSNDHCNQAGVYHIVPKTIAFESGLPESDLSALLKILEPEVKWLPKQNLVWVKNFIFHQAKSPKFLIAAAKCLKKTENDGLVAEVVEYNKTRYTISIPYEYSIDRVSIPPVSVSVSVSRSSSEKEAGVVKGKGETEVAPKGAGDSHRAEGDGAIISAWHSVKGWSLTPDEELELAARLTTEFPELALLAESQTWAARKLSEPLKPNSKPSQQIWNWMRKGRQFAEERRSKGEQGQGQRAKVHPREAYRGKW